MRHNPGSLRALNGIRYSRLVAYMCNKTVPDTLG